MPQLKTVRPGNDPFTKAYLDRGWQGMVAELTGEADDSSVRSPVSCPDCGGSEFEQRADKDEKENA